jgi:hypothetical protein
MILQYLINIYDYIISFISSSRPTIKHKNSEDISEDDVEETIFLNKKSDETSRKNNYNTRESKVSPITSRSKTYIPFEKYPIYECGHCDNSIRTPQYLFQDLVFCSIMCRTQYMSLIQNTKQNAFV